MSAPVVLLHPLAASSSFWEPVRERLPRELTVVAVDLPGHGRAPLPAADPSLDDWGRRVLDAVDELGHTEFTVVGMSLGGLVAAQLAATTNRVRALVVADAVDIYPDPMREMWSNRAAISRRDGLESFVEPTMSLWFSPAFRDRAGPVIERALSQMASTSNEGYARATELLASVDLRPSLGSIRCPTLVVCGRGDGAAFVDAAPRLARSIPHAELQWLEGQHATAVEEPGAFAEAVSAFLARSLDDQHEVAP